MYNRQNVLADACEPARWRQNPDMDGEGDATTDLLAARLVQRFPEVAPETVTAVVRETHRHFAGQPIQQFTPLLVENLARKRLRQARAEVDPPSPSNERDPAAPATGPPEVAEPGPDQ